MATLTFKENELHPEGQFRAKIVCIETEDQQYGPAFRVTLVTEEGTVEAICSTSYTRQSKLTSLVKAALGEIPQSLDTDCLLERQVGIVVEHIQKDKATFHRVASFLRLKTKKEDPFEEI